ncbi:MAG: alpha/beta hydrolase [Alphaproteobacteria bacterium]|nr:alpha/beta hydrolase [Alphaproteobacteria bacterium]
MILIDGPRIPPRSGTAKKLVILFHGYGSNGQDLAGLAQAWAPNFPDVAWASPNAPEQVPGYPQGYQWFPISRLDPDLMEQGVRSAHASAEQFVKSELKRWGLEDGDVVLVGFSQGTMMALHTALRRETAPAGVLGYSGALAGPERLKQEMTAKPPVMLIHGDQDDVLPVGMTLMAAQGLCAAGHGAEFHISQGIPHSIGPDGLELGQRFIANALAGKLA